MYSYIYICIYVSTLLSDLSRVCPESRGPTKHFRSRRLTSQFPHGGVRGFRDQHFGGGHDEMSTP